MDIKLIPNMADLFFETLSELDSETCKIFSDIEKGELFIKLPVALKTVDGLGFRFLGAQLLSELANHPAYLASRVPHEAKWGDADPKIATCWVFNAFEVALENYPSLERRGGNDL